MAFEQCHLRPAVEQAGGELLQNVAKTVESTAFWCGVGKADRSRAVNISILFGLEGSRADEKLARFSLERHMDIRAFSGVTRSSERPRNFTGVILGLLPISSWTAVHYG